MTLQNDFEILTGDKDRAKLIVEDLLAGDRTRSDAYRNIVSEAKTVQIDVVRISVLVLKYEYERQRAMGMADRIEARWGAGWDIEEHFDALAHYGAPGLVRACADLTVLVAEILELGLQKLPIDSDGIEYFADRHRVSESQLANISDGTSDQYRKMKRRWLHQNIELRCVESNHSDAIKRANSIRQAFMTVFGKQFLAERTQLNRMYVARRRLEFVRENPGAGDVSFGHSRVLHSNHDGVQLGRHELDIRDSHFTHLATNFESETDGYSKAKSYLRRLAFLTHPDKVSQADLTRKQTRRLAAIWQKTNSLRVQRSNKSVLISSVPLLERKLSQAERIMELSHIKDLDAEMVVQGETIEDRIQWLACECCFLTERIKILRAESGDLSTNRQLSDMRELVDAPLEVQIAERQTMVEKCKAYRRRAKALERAASRVLASVA